MKNKLGDILTVRQFFQIQDFIEQDIHKNVLDQPASYFLESLKNAKREEEEKVKEAQDNIQKIKELQAIITVAKE